MASGRTLRRIQVVAVLIPAVAAMAGGGYALARAFHSSPHQGLGEVLTQGHGSRNPEGPLGCGVEFGDSRLSVGTDNVEANAPSIDMVLSADGRFVAFASQASNLVPGDTNSVQDVFVFDRQTGQLDLRLESVRVADADGELFAAFPDLSAGFSLGSLLQGKLMPTRLVIEHPVLRLDFGLGAGRMRILSHGQLLRVIAAADRELHAVGTRRLEDPHADGRQRAADVAVVDMDMVQAGAQLALCYSYAQNEPDVCVLASLAQHVYTHQGTGP